MIKIQCIKTYKVHLEGKVQNAYMYTYTWLKQAKEF